MKLIDRFKSIKSRITEAVAGARKYCADKFGPRTPPRMIRLPILHGYAETLRAIMARTGRGYRQYSAKNTGRDASRRRDRLEIVGHNDGTPVLGPRDESKLQYRARVHRIGVCH